MPKKATSPHAAKATSAGDAGFPARKSETLLRLIKNWIADGKAQGWSPRTLYEREHDMGYVIWWLENEEEVPATLSALTASRIRAFLTYAREPHPTGRWGSTRASARREARPGTVAAYHRILRAFLNFCQAEGLLEETPLKNVKPPRVPKDQIQPFAPEQVQGLLDAARRTRLPERNLAMIYLLLDTGLRVSELCSLKVSDVDRGAGELTVTGKGNKKRRVYMGVAARRVLWRYLEADRRQADGEEPLFVSVTGHTPGDRLTPTGVRQMISLLGKEANIRDVRCSPHTLRHTFAINFLRNGGNILELQRLMGHTDVKVLQRYVALAEVDLAQAHRAASPADRMKLK